MSRKLTVFDLIAKWKIAGLEFHRAAWELEKATVPIHLVFDTAYAVDDGLITTSEDQAREFFLESASEKHDMKFSKPEEVQEYYEEADPESYVAWFRFEVPIVERSKRDVGSGS